MGTSLEEWQEFFDEQYLRAWTPSLDEERTRDEALGAIAFAGVAPGAEILDCPCGFGRHALVLTEAGYRVTGADVSGVQLGEAERRRGAAEWPRLVRADYRELPFPDGSFDAVLNLFTAIGYYGLDGDRRVFAEARRVLRPGGTFVLETQHRDRIVTIHQSHAWEELPDGALALHERRFDPVTSVHTARFLLVEQDGSRHERGFEVRVYTATELDELLAEAGFAERELFGAFDGETPVSTATRVVVRAR